MDQAVSGNVTTWTPLSDFTDRTHIQALWESCTAVYAAHIRGQQMTLGDPSHPAETCTRKLPATGDSTGK